MLISRMTRRVKQWRTDMLMLDRRTLLRAGSAAVGAAALAPPNSALARVPKAGKWAHRTLLGTPPASG